MRLKLFYSVTTHHRPFGGFFRKSMFTIHHPLNSTMFKMMVRMIMIVHCSPVFVTMMMERMISIMTTMMFVEMMMLFNVYCTINVHIMASFFDSGFCVTMLLLKLWHIWIFLLLLLLLLLLWILLFLICFIQGLLWLPHGLICWHHSSCRCCGIGDLGRTAAWGTYSYATKESNNHKIASVHITNTKEHPF